MFWLLEQRVRTLEMEGICPKDIKKVSDEPQCRHVQRRLITSDRNNMVLTFQSCIACRYQKLSKVSVSLGCFHSEAVNKNISQLFTKEASLRIRQRTSCRLQKLVAFLPQTLWVKLVGQCGLHPAVLWSMMDSSSLFFVAWGHTCLCCKGQPQAFQAGIKSHSRNRRRHD